MLRLNSWRASNWGALCAAVALLGVSSGAAAQTGVSDDRVSLPEGPGSLEGVGENVEIDPNMGSMTYNVPFDLPAGFDAVTPELGLSYNSGGGGSVVGMGWSMSVPSIERMTYRKLPRYTRADDFAANGSEQLVLLPSTDPPVYRARYEKGFARHTWIAAEDGAEGYWLAEYPDGSKGTFGATMDGTLVPNARVSGDEGTFRYMLVEKVDVYGHRVVYSYQKDGFSSLLSHIGYVFTDENNPTYAVTLEYEERAGDGRVDYLSDAKPGFDERLTQRLAAVNVLTRGVRVRRYQLSYDPYTDSGGLTRLARVETIGLQGGTYPVAFNFAYSESLGGVCDGDGCERPFITDMGSLGVNLGSGRATLIDINGDGLPDVLDTTHPTAHRFFLSVPDAAGRVTFDTTPTPSAVADGSEFQLGAPGTQILDVNGDGFADLLKATAAGSSALLNRGNGDWEVQAMGEGLEALADAFANDFEEGELQQLKFIDYNNDKLIDVMRSTQDTTSVFENRGELGFASLGVEPIGRDFAADGVQFADMNGDGLLDVIRVQPSSVSYRLNRGWGRWAPWTTINDLPITEVEVPLAELEDLNGDGLADLVLVGSTAVKYALNTNGASFAPTVEVVSSRVNGELPPRDATTTVLYADMNGNGSSDIVWLDANGQTNALELFPVRPNLLSRVTNDIGMVTDVQYETAVVQMARDGGWRQWRHKLPYPMLVVSRVDRYDLLTDLHEITAYTYHDGFYDGLEKQFRGFERVETRLIGDATQEEGLTLSRYDVGAADPYRNGLLLEQAFMSADRELSVVENTYSDCDVAEVPVGTEFPVRHVCMTGARTTLKEGLSEAEWVVTESEMTYDGYGNVTRSVERGVTSIGGDGCAPCAEGRGPDEFGEPCGAQCLGDESYSETEYVTPDNTGGRWILNAPFERRSYGRPGSDLVTRTRTYYDGPDFEGLPLGQLELGDITRVTERSRVGSDDVIEMARNAYDAHGNVVDAIDPNGQVGGHTHRRRYTYDEDGLRVVRAEVLLEDPNGAPYTLRRDVLFESIFDNPADVSQWMIVDADGQLLSTPRSTSLVYDQFGRRRARVKPGDDTLEAPSEEYAYDLQRPASRVIIRRRSEEQGPLDLETILCVDGRGRTFQTRTLIEPGLYQVTGMTLYNVRSSPVRVYQPYTSPSPECDLTPPDGVLFSSTRYDATNRPVEERLADEGIFGAASLARTVYRPLTTLQYDPEDNDPSSAHADTPSRYDTNGLGQLVALERRLTGAPPARVEVRYDPLGRTLGYTDPEGNSKEQEFDLLDRVTRIIDPNSADETTFEYDAVGNVIRSTDDRGVVTRAAYDGMNRPTARWDEADPDGTRITWAYDVAPSCDRCTNAEGRLVSLSYPGTSGQLAREHLGYDQRGRAIYRARALSGHTFAVTATFDNVDRLVSATYPNGRTIARGYDDASRLTAIEGILDGATYDARDLLAGVAYADGSSVTMSYDDLMRPVEKRTVGSDGGLLQGFGYEHDRVGNVRAIHDLAPSPMSPSFEASYTYDAWYRLLEARLAPETDQEETVFFEHDVIDNIASQTSSRTDSPANKGAYGYDSYAPNAVTQVGELLLDYDPAGHMSERGDLRMTWDFLGRMTAAGQATRFVYGANQSRVAKLEGDSATLYLFRNFEVRDGISTLYVMMGRHRVARIEDDQLATDLLTDAAPDGQINAADAWLTHTAEAGSSGPWLWSSVRRLMIETGPADGTTWLHHDHLGSLTLATAEVDGQTAVVGERSFLPLGQERALTGYVDEYGFTGQELDRSTGLLHFDWRYYDPNIGRWLSIDPLFATTSSANITNLGNSTTAYAYVGGNYTNLYDPTGLKPKGGEGQRPTARQVASSVGSGTRRAVRKGLSKAKKKLGGSQGDKRIAAQDSSQTSLAALRSGSTPEGVPSPNPQGDKTWRGWRGVDDPGAAPATIEVNPAGEGGSQAEHRAEPGLVASSLLRRRPGESPFHADGRVAGYDLQFIDGLVSEVEGKITRKREIEAQRVRDNAQRANQGQDALSRFLLGR